MTLRQLAAPLESIPATTSWFLADLGEARGKQAFLALQSAHRLKQLWKHSLIESSVSSHRIEGVVVDPSRIRTVLHGKSSLRDPEEKGSLAYRDALQLIHERAGRLAF